VGPFGPLPVDIHQTPNLSVERTDCMGITQKLIAAARAYRDDPKRNRHLFVEAINASTNDNHRSLEEVSEVTGYSEVELKSILSES
jgi:hypothetical protein